MKVVPDGIAVTFKPEKQKGPKVEETFLIPKRKCDGGVDYSGIVSLYIEGISEDISPSPDQSFWYRGNPEKGSVPSRFVLQHLGYNRMAEVPKFIAKQLGHPDDIVEKYKGHSFRRTAATLMADQGYTGQQIRDKLNLISGRSVNEYISSSKSVQNSTDNLLACNDDENDFDTSENPHKKRKLNTALDENDIDQLVSIFKDSFVSCWPVNNRFFI